MFYILVASDQTSRIKNDLARYDNVLDRFYIKPIPGKSFKEVIERRNALISNLV